MRRLSAYVEGMKGIVERGQVRLEGHWRRAAWAPLLRHAYHDNDNDNDIMAKIKLVRSCRSFRYQNSDELIAVPSCLLGQGLG